MVYLTITTGNVLSLSFRLMILNVLEINIVFAFRFTVRTLIGLSTVVCLWFVPVLVIYSEKQLKDI